MTSLKIRFVVALTAAEIAVALMGIPMGAQQSDWTDLLLDETLNPQKLNDIGLNACATETQNFAGLRGTDFSLCRTFSAPS